MLASSPRRAVKLELAILVRKPTREQVPRRHGPRHRRIDTIVGTFHRPALVMPTMATERTIRIYCFRPLARYT